MLMGQFAAADAADVMEIGYGGHLVLRAWRRIAATALIHGMTVVTRNVADFAGTGIPIMNPWKP